MPDTGVVHVGDRTFPVTDFELTRRDDPNPDFDDVTALLAGGEFEVTVALENVDPLLINVMTCHLEHPHTIDECVGWHIVLGEN